MTSTLIAGAPAIVPIGTIIDFAGSTTPAGYLECDGSAVGRTTWPLLFAAIGTTWGAGDGSTTFNLPDIRSRMTVGVGSNGVNTVTSNGTVTAGEHNYSLGTRGGEYTHLLTVGEMPSHNHAQRLQDGGSDAGNAAYDWRITSTTRLYAGSDLATYAGGGSAHRNIPPYATVRKLIRAA